MNQMADILSKLFLFFLPIGIMAQTNISQNLNAVNFHFLEKFQASSPRKSIFYSPYSLTTALAMLHEGADGNSAQALQTALLLPADEQTRQEAFLFLQKSLNDKQHCTVRINNAIWIQQDFVIKSAFHDRLARYHQAHSQNLDFQRQPEASRTKINAWVEDKTNGLIKEAMPGGTINAATSVVLTNTIYFKGKFKFPFNKKLTQEQNFTNLDHSISKVQMMQHGKSQNLSYFEDTQVQLLELPYEGGVSIWIALPRRHGFEDLAQLNAEQFKSWQTGSRATDVVAYLPRLKFEASYDMIPILGEMGLKNLFTDAADLSRISDTPLFVSAVIHKAYIDLSEETTEAAAFTGVAMARSTAPNKKQPVYFRADRPFMFFIQDRQTGTILFSGVVKQL